MITIQLVTWILSALVLVSCERTEQKIGRKKDGFFWEPATGTLTHRAGKTTTPIEFVWIEPGAFTMGSADNPRTVLKEGPPRVVRIRSGFWFGKYEVTRGQWDAILGTGKTTQSDLPVTRVSWHDLQSFIQELNQAEGIRFRLPTEAEWEYACRGGTDSRWSFGDDPRQLPQFAWYRNNSEARLHPVGRKSPNPWALFDMHGNAVEWTQDTTTSSASKALRGGFVVSEPDETFCSCRYHFPASYGYQFAGFRLAAD